MRSKKRRTERTDNGEGRWTEIQYVGDKIDGLWTVYRRDGSKDWERQYVKGLQTGYSRSWDENGLLLEETWYLKNLLHGPWRRWYPNGILQSHSNFVHSKEDGLQSRWGETGEVIAFGTVVNGVRHGTFIGDVVNKGRTKRMIMEYRDGKLITDLNWMKRARPRARESRPDQDAK